MILYADHETDAMREFIAITKSHRERQEAYNREHGIVPHTAKRALNESAYVFSAGKPEAARKGAGGAAPAADGVELLEELTRDMLKAADNLEFEHAAYLRDQIKALKRKK